MDKLSHAKLREVAAMCAAVALLLLAAWGIARVSVGTTSPGSWGVSQAAATTLGDTQSVPLGYTGQTYPADTLCFINWSFMGYGGSPTPVCPTIGYSYWNYNGIGHPATDTFATGIFSIDLGGGVGRSLYETRTVTAGYTYQQDMGPACPTGFLVSSYSDSSGISYYCGSGSPDFGYQYVGPTCPNGGTFSGIFNPDFGWNTTECYQSVTVAPILSSPSGDIPSGTAPTVTTGQSMTMEWSCLPSRAVAGALHGSGYTSYGVISLTGGWTTTSLYHYNLATSVTGSGAGFFPSGLVGTQTVVAPSTAGTYNYSLTCSGGTNTMTIPVTVLAAPSISITGNGTNPTAAIVGQPITITATFGAGGGDSLTNTAINDNANNLWCGSGNTCNTSMWTASPIGTKTYTFTPQSAGPYVFYPAVRTSQYASWSNYGKSLSITVSNQCTNGQGPATACTSCNSGYVLVSGSCMVQCANGQGPAGQCTSCSSGYVLVAGSCMVQCPHGTGTATQCLSCNSGYVLQNGNCVLPTGVVAGALAASPMRVTRGGASTLTWSTTGMSSCLLTDDTGATISTQTSSSGTTVSNITRPRTFTLTCTDGVAQYTSGPITVSLLPTFQEI